MKNLCVFACCLLLTLNPVAPQENDCKCVRYYLCNKDTGFIITDGRGIVTERFGGACKCECPKGHVCCALPPDTDSTSSVEPTSSTTVAYRGADNSKCGFLIPDGIGFKAGNKPEDAAFGEFPWMVAVLKKDGGYRCGGSLIHPSVVLTAAHCVVKPGSYIARAGEWDSSTTKELLKHQDRDIVSIKIHEEYKPGIYYNDVALLHLDTPFDLADNIQVVCLPNKELPARDGTCIATGWGKDKFGSAGQYPAILRKVLLPMVPHDKCQENLRKTRVGPYFKLHKSFVCAGGEKGKDTCIGDGGGPLVCPLEGEDHRYVQVGITSWGVDCHEENVPGVYSNVPFLREWIDGQFQKNNFETHFYEI